MKKTIYILVILILGCKENKDPFKNLMFDGVSKNKIIQNLLKNQVICEPRRDIDGNDSIAYTYYFEDEFGKIPVKLEANPNDYDFGQLREIKLTVNEFEGFFINRVEDSLESSYLKRIKKIYQEWYNKPDTLNSLMNLPGSGGKLVWKEPLFNIYINNISSEPNIETYIIYRTLDYDKKIKRIKDSIIDNQTIKQLVVDGKVNFNWKKISNIDERFEFTVYNISRKDKYDGRSIKSLRFDLCLEDEFGKILYYEDDFTIELNHELAPSSHSYYIAGNEQMYYVDYNINDNNFRKLEEARKYSKNYSVKGIAKIKAVVMDDGSIVKRME